MSFAPVISIVLFLISRLITSASAASITLTVQVLKLESLAWQPNVSPM